MVVKSSDSTPKSTRAARPTRSVEISKYQIEKYVAGENLAGAKGAEVSGGVSGSEKQLFQIPGHTVSLHLYRRTSQKI